MTPDDFDEKQYWIARHERLRGDVRSVGNLGKSVERNLAGQARARERLKRVLARLVPNARGKTALDLGCGIGLLAPVLVEHGFRYTGVEISPVAVEQARARGLGDAAEFRVGDMVGYRDDRRFDLVVASYVLVHLVEDADWLAALKNVAGWLKDEGIFLLVDEVPAEKPLDTARHVVTRTLARYREVLPTLGLRLEESFLDFDRAELGNFFAIERIR